jgi:hypothetical protein
MHSSSTAPSYALNSVDTAMPTRTSPTITDTNRSTLRPLDRGPRTLTKPANRRSADATAAKMDAFAHKLSVGHIRVPYSGFGL